MPDSTILEIDPQLLIGYLMAGFAVFAVPMSVVLGAKFLISAIKEL